MRKLSLALSLAMAFGMCHASNVYLNASNYVVHASEDWVPVKDTTVLRRTSRTCGSAGTRRGEVAVVQKDGKVSFVANTARDRDEATCYYEIVR